MLVAAASIRHREQIKIISISRRDSWAAIFETDSQDCRRCRPSQWVRARPKLVAILMMIDIHQRHLNFIWSQPRRQILTIIVSVIVPAHG